MDLDGFQVEHLTYRLPKAIVHVKRISAGSWHVIADDFTAGATFDDLDQAKAAAAGIARQLDEAGAYEETAAAIRRRLTSELDQHAQRRAGVNKPRLAPLPRRRSAS